MRSALRSALWCAAGLLGALGLERAAATMRYPTDWPVARMLENVARYAERHPEAAEAHYCLGRMHSYSFVFETAQLALTVSDAEGFGQRVGADQVTLDELAKLVACAERQTARKGSRPGPSSSARLEHLASAVSALRRALALAPDEGAYHLTLAYTLEHGAHLAHLLDNWALFGAGEYPEKEPLEADVAACIRDLGDPQRAEQAYARLAEPRRLALDLFHLDRERASSNPVRQRNVARLLERWWLDQAVDQYRRAFELSIEHDRAEPFVHDWWGLVALEAAESWVRLAEAAPGRFPDTDGFAARVADELRALRKKTKLSVLTPICFSLEGCRPLDELVAPGSSVLFDLDGDLVEEPWPWLRPDAAWLVWDPKRSGHITSGRQLFGSASAWFAFPDGYRVLDALDDDSSGELRGAELAGIAVWFDRDSDGVSDAGEVAPVEALGIVALATRATERIGASLGNPCGIELADGRVLPSYDWVLAPVDAP